MLRLQPSLTKYETDTYENAEKVAALQMTSAPVKRAAESWILVNLPAQTPSPDRVTDHSLLQDERVTHLDLAQAQSLFQTAQSKLRDIDHSLVSEHRYSGWLCIFALFINAWYGAKGMIWKNDIQILQQHAPYLKNRVEILQTKKDAEESFREADEVRSTIELDVHRQMRIRSAEQRKERRQKVKQGVIDGSVVGLGGVSYLVVGGHAAYAGPAVAASYILYRLFSSFCMRRETREEASRTPALRVEDPHESTVTEGTWTKYSDPHIAKAMLKAHLFRITRVGPEEVEFILNQFLPPNIESFSYNSNRDADGRNTFVLQLTHDTSAEITEVGNGAGAWKKAVGTRMTAKREIRGYIDIENYKIIFDDHQLISKKSWCPEVRLTEIRFQEVVVRGNPKTRVILTGTTCFGSGDTPWDLSELGATFEHLNWPRD